ncbi:hypothetical protein BRI6_3034 [plant metagenome]|uniref:Uncharacterized protein n=1 Tax=plant metagenome TaxID=1297885 RepID=A0A484RZ42_9ZZZZ
MIVTAPFACSSLRAAPDQAAGPRVREHYVLRPDRDAES